ncbi:MAG: FG-GAP-like repeat-containing protein [Acidobacteriota bacterium]
MSGTACLLSVLLLIFSSFSPAFLQTQPGIESVKREISRGSAAEARRLLDEILARNPKDAEANYWMGYLHAKADEYDQAIHCLQIALNKNRKPDTLKLLAKVLGLSGKSVEAESLLLELTGHYPSDAEGWSLLGLLYQNRNRFPEAVKPLETAVALNPGNVPALNSLAFVYFALGKMEEAERTFKKAIDRNERLARPLADPHASYAIFLLRMNRVKEAGEQVRNAERINPSNPDVAKAKLALESRLRSSAATTRIRRPVGLVPRLVDLAAASGIAFRLENHATPTRHQIETMPGGLAVLDYDNDGLVDLYFTNGAESPSLRKTSDQDWNRLYRNRGNFVFADVTDRAGVAGIGYMMGAAAADYDNDGFTDLFVVGVDRNILYRNFGDGTFADVTEKAGLLGLHPRFGRMWGIHATWLDVDNDGWLDLFVVNYCIWDPENEPFCGDRRPGHRAYCYPGKYGALPNQLFRNNRDGTFTDISVSSGIDAHLGKGMGAAIADFDSDGLMDIFVANDTEPNFLFHNRGNSCFSEEAYERGVALNQFGTPMSSMGADFRDFDNDGRADLFVTALANEGFLLFRNNGRFFEDVRDAAGLTIPTLPFGGWSNAIADFNNDGWKDLFSANSHALDNIELFQDRSYLQANQIFLNQSDGTFTDVSAQIPGFQRKAAHRGSAVVDLDNDGRLDLVVTALGSRPEIYRNRTEGGHWLVLRLQGREANRQGLGALACVETEDGRKLWNQATTSVGFASSSDPRVHFGLGQSNRVKSLEIVWPGGKRQKLDGVEVDRILEISEPAG